MARDDSQMNSALHAKQRVIVARIVRQKWLNWTHHRIDCWVVHNLRFRKTGVLLHLVGFEDTARHQPPGATCSQSGVSHDVILATAWLWPALLAIGALLEPVLLEHKQRDGISGHS